MTDKADWRPITLVGASDCIRAWRSDAQEDTVLVNTVHAKLNEMEATISTLKNALESILDFSGDQSHVIYTAKTALEETEE